MSVSEGRRQSRAQRQARALRGMRGHGMLNTFLRLRFFSSSSNWLIPAQMFPFLRVIARTYRTGSPHAALFHPAPCSAPVSAVCRLRGPRAVCAPREHSGHCQRADRGPGQKTRAISFFSLFSRAKPAPWLPAQDSLSPLPPGPGPGHTAAGGEGTPRPIVRGHRTQCSRHPLFGGAVHQLELEAGWEQREELPRQDKRGLFQQPAQQHH